MSFSPDGTLLASSGKDRRLCLWRRGRVSSGDNDAPQSSSFSLAAAVDSAHRRIVWSVHFCPFRSSVRGDDDRDRPYLLASGARDGFVKLWRVVVLDEEDDDAGSDGGEVRLEECHKFEAASVLDGRKGEAVTAVAFAPIPTPSSSTKDLEAILAVGTEGGRIGMWSIRL
eukprot:CAMPEP_0197442640 /NCGR_PEP_ID=MMETSP1175-20131217/8617_1 /TAXON_ID=1003142 /ORGANISM="Triceratium dubium, Strain CCMP147" /LENGTH=169 /DNA_ID=CAMNT_0042973155 /DNA_START=30 /DNA_END=535 /DNA_ORIENTATION=+